MKQYSDEDHKEDDRCHCKNGKKTGEIRNLYSARTEATFKNLKFYEDNEEVEYTVQETKVTGADIKASHKE